MFPYVRKTGLTIVSLLTTSMLLLAQAEQESPFQSNETVTKGEGGIGSAIWIVVGIVLLLVIFFFLRKGGSGATRAGNPK